MVRRGDDALLLTIAEAAAHIGVTMPAVHQMLRKGRLDGPTFAGRAPKGAGRVTFGSAERARQRRGAPRRRATRRPRVNAAVAELREEVRNLKAEVTRLTREVGTLRHRQAVADSALLHIKIAADEARGAARETRGTNRALLRQVSELARLGQETNDQADVVDNIAEHYSDTLTALLVPPDAASIDSAAGSDH